MSLSAERASIFRGRSPAVLLAPCAVLLSTGLAANLAAAADEADQGISFDAVYTGDLIRNFDGGVRTGGTYLDNLDLQLIANPGSIFGVPGLSGMVYVLHNNSAEFSADYVGDAHVISNIDAPRGFKLYEAWLDWASANDGFSARVGLYDLNSEFDAIDTGALFINSASGIGTDFGQTGLNGPSIFPVTSLALRLRTRFGAGGYAQFAVLDGVPGDPDDPDENEIALSSEDGALLVAEAGYGGGNWRKLALGAWSYTADFERLTDPDGPQDDGNHGWYAIADRYLLGNDDAGSGPVVAGFLRIGQAAERYNPIHNYVGAGITMGRFSRLRPDDELGLAVSVGMNGDDYEEARLQEGLGTKRTETNIELTWRAPVTDWLTLQPDIQYVINPGTDPDLDNAFVIALRFELAFSRAL